MTTPSTIDRCRGALLVAAGAYLALLPTGLLSFWRSLAFGASALLAVAIIVLERRRGGGVPLPDKAIPVAALAWALWALASVAWSVDPRLSAGEVKADVLWGLLTFVIFYVAATTGPLAFDRLASAMLGALAFFTALAAGIAMSAHGWNVDPFHRGEGALATFLVTAAPFMLLLAWRPPVGLNRGVRTWIVATLLLVLLVVTARMSENRVVWIAFAASFAVAMLLSPPTRARGRAVAGAGALLLVFGLLFTDAARERASHVRPGDTSVAATLSADPRLVIWKSASEHIRARPWLGYGYGLHILGREIGRDTGDAKVMHPHNLFASQWLQTGAIGAALFTIMLGAVAHRFVRFTRMKDVALARLGAIGLAVLVGFLIRNLTDDFFLRANGKLLFAACAILLGAGTLRRKELERASGGAAPAAAAAP